MEEILTPNQYHDIMKKHGRVFVFGEDWEVKDYAAASKDVLKKTMPFPMRSSRVHIYRKKRFRCRFHFQETYTGDEIEAMVLKPDKHSVSSMTKALVIPKTSHITVAKRNDVRKLIKYCTIPDSAKKFYDDVFRVEDGKDDERDEDVPVLVYEDVEPFE